MSVTHPPFSDLESDPRQGQCCIYCNRPLVSEENGVTLLAAAIQVTREADGLQAWICVETCGVIRAKAWIESHVPPYKCN